MSFITEHRVSRGHFAVVTAAFALVLLALLATAVRAQAAEVLYWDNYSTNPDSIGFANPDGSGGGALNLTGSAIEGPEGIAYDSVTNRLFVANEEGGPNGQITAINLDGSGAHPFTAPGAPIEEPEGITVDPVTRMIYWINTEPDTISWARLDGSAGGTLNTTGANVNGGFRLALDPVAQRVYWGTSNVPAGIYFADVNNTGGGSLDTTGATTPLGASGIAVDPASGRVYWTENSAETISFANLNNTGGGDVNTAGATFDEPYGLAFDPTLGKFYWGNYGKGAERTGAIGFSFLAGGGGGIDIAAAPSNGVQDPLVLKSPTGTAAPAVTRDAKVRAQLTCSQGSWGADFSGSFVYQAPRTFAYQWTNNGVAVPGATAATLLTTAPGSYACVVTATNQTGSASQTSLATPVTASKLKLTVKKKAKVKAGRVATFKVQAVNQGDLEASKAKVCAKLSKKAKKGLKAPKCATFGKANAAGKRIAKLKVKTRKTASGSYKLTLQVKGSAGKAAKVKVVVAQSKAKKKK
jgi:DNA-binding beta-propeller fold protein YncE